MKKVFLVGEPGTGGDMIEAMKELAHRKKDKTTYTMVTISRKDLKRLDELLKKLEKE